MNVKPNIRLLLDTLESEAQIRKDATSSKLSGETSSENCTPREEFPIDVDRGLRGNALVTINLDREMDPLPIPPMSSIDLLVRPKGLPIVVSQNLQAVNMPSYLHKFYETKDEDPSRHRERYIDKLASS